MQLDANLFLLDLRWPRRAGGVGAGRLRSMQCGRGLRHRSNWARLPIKCEHKAVDPAADSQQRSVLLGKKVSGIRNRIREWFLFLTPFLLQGE